MPLVEVHRDQDVVRVTLARPSKRNALSPQLLSDLREELEDVAAQAPRCLVLAGKGPVFCAGGDLAAMQERLGRPEATVEVLRSGVNAAVTALAEFPAPTLAVVQGAAIGAGLGLALACDTVLVEEEATLGATQTRLGLTPDAGTSWFLTQHLGPRRALDLLQGGRTISGAEAAELGLVTAALPSDRLEKVVEERTAALAAGPTRALVKTRQLVLDASALPLEEALEREALSQGMMYATDDQREGVEAFLEKREPTFQGR